MVGCESTVTQQKFSKKEIAKYIDHTNVSPNSKPKDIEKLCREAAKYDFYGVVVVPYYVRLARKLLRNTDVKLSTVIGFPFGVQCTEAKLKEMENVFRYVDEFDVVMNRPAFKARDYNHVLKELKRVVKAAENKPVKVIIETPELTNTEIKKATELVLRSGAAFVKTAVGLKGPAQLKHVSIMASVTKGRIGIKASGGIRNCEQAIEFIKAGATRIGSSHGVDIIRTCGKSAKNVKWAGKNKSEGLFHE